MVVSWHEWCVVKYIKWSQAILEYDYSYYNEASDDYYYDYGWGYYDYEEYDYYNEEYVAYVEDLYSSEYPPPSCAEEGITALHISVFEENKKMISKLSAVPEIQMDMETSLGFTPLGYSAMMGWSDIMEILIQHGANISYQNTRFSFKALKISDLKRLIFFLFW